jgi:large subunit ribosomal protein L25
MKDLVLKAERREVVGKQVRALRRAGRLPAVIYGKNVTPINISLDMHDASLVLPSISSSHLIVVDVSGIRHNALVREKQRHPVTGNYVHIDFQEVSLTEKLRTEISLLFEGEAPAVKNLDGILAINIESIEVEALPGDLPDHIRVDLAAMTDIGSAITVSDLQVSEKVRILSSLQDIVAVISPPSVEAAIELEGAFTAEPEVLEKGKKEEDF